jgi:hypothetical protein
VKWCHSYSVEVERLKSAVVYQSGVSWQNCHVEWLSEEWYIRHHKEMQLWHVTFAIKVLSVFGFKKK